MVSLRLPASHHGRYGQVHQHLLNLPLSALICKDPVQEIPEIRYLLADQPLDHF
jgi:hypothetical protein